MTRPPSRSSRTPTPDHVSQMFSLPPELILAIIKLTKCSRDVRSVAATCKWLRNIVHVHRDALPLHRVDHVDEIDVWLGRRVRVEYRTVYTKRGRTQSVETKQMELGPADVLVQTRLLRLCPRRHLIVRMRQLDDETLELIRQLRFGVGGAEDEDEEGENERKERVVKLEVDKCTISKAQLISLLKWLNPRELHLGGMFDRNLVDDELLTSLPSLCSLFVGVSPQEDSALPSISHRTLTHVVENHSAGGNFNSQRNITLPACNMDREGFEKFLETLVLSTHFRRGDTVFTLYGTPLGADMNAVQDTFTRVTDRAGQNPVPGHEFTITSYQVIQGYSDADGTYVEPIESHPVMEEEEEQRNVLPLGDAAPLRGAMRPAVPIGLHLSFRNLDARYRHMFDIRLLTVRSKLRSLIPYRSTVESLGRSERKRARTRSPVKRNTRSRV